MKTVSICTEMLEVASQGFRMAADIENHRRRNLDDRIEQGVRTATARWIQKDTIWPEALFKKAGGKAFGWSTVKLNSIR